VNRADWQETAEEKLLAVDALLAASQWASAYYLAGYAIECGLKSCVLARLAGFPEVIFDVKVGKTFSKDCWTHDVEALVGLAGLKPELDAAIAGAPALAAHWQVVAEWNEVTRYQRKTELEAQKLYNAIADPVNGVMQWIKSHW
jgi:hypothetical protein